MFHRSLALVDDSAAVELGRDSSYRMFLTVQYRKSGKHSKRSVPNQIRTLLSELFGTASVVTSHTYLSANRFNGYARIGSQWIWVDELAQVIRSYLCHCLDLRSSSRVYKHSIYLHLVLCPMDPLSDPVLKIPVCLVTGKTVNGICSRRFSKLSRENFDRFLVSQSLSKEARYFMSLPEEKEVKDTTPRASTPGDTKGKQCLQTCNYSKGGRS